MTLRKTRRSGNKHRGHSLTRKLRMYTPEQHGGGDDGETQSLTSVPASAPASAPISAPTSASAPAPAPAFSLPFSLPFVDSEPESTETEKSPSKSESSPPEPESVPVKESPPKAKLDDVSSVQKSFEMYYGVEDGDVINTEPDVNYQTMHTEYIDEKDMTFKKKLGKNTDIAVLYHSTIGFEDGILKYPAFKLLKGKENPNSPSNVVIKVEKLPLRVSGRVGVYVKTMALVMKTSEDVLPGTEVIFPYLPSFIEGSSEIHDSVQSVRSEEEEEVSVEEGDDTLSVRSGEDDTRVGEEEDDTRVSVGEEEDDMSVISLGEISGTPE